MPARPDNPRIHPGHNQGPAMEPGRSWRLHCWRKARADLLPNALPIEVIRARVRRAGELGLNYRTYASIRAASGHDVVAILFSSNALRLLKARQIPAARLEKLDQLRKCTPAGVAILPVTPGELGRAAPQLAATFPAPVAFTGWAHQRAGILSACQGTPSDQVVLVGDTMMEREWAQAGRLARFLPGDQYFTAAPDAPTAP